MNVVQIFRILELQGFFFSFVLNFSQLIESSSIFRIFKISWFEFRVEPRLHLIVLSYIADSVD